MFYRSLEINYKLFERIKRNSRGEFLLIENEKSVGRSQIFNLFTISYVNGGKRQSLKLYQKERRLIFRQVCLNKREKAFVALILPKERRHNFFTFP